MFEGQKSAPWYKSRKLLIAIPIAVILIAGVWGLYMWMGSRARDAHDAEVEAHRRQQAAQPATEAAPAQTAAPVAQPSASASPTNPADTPKTAHADDRNYWTNFRGPRRDGKYDESSVSTNWPANGLPVVWKQPVGLGHSSFAVADGKAFTIEQRLPGCVAVRS